MASVSDGNLSKLTLDTTSDDLSCMTSYTEYKSDFSEDDTLNDTNLDELTKLKQSNSYNKKKFKNDIQLLKIELSQRDLLADNARTDYDEKLEEMRAREHLLVNQKALLQAKLDSQIKIERESARQQHNQISGELANILKRQQQLEEANGRLQEKASDIRAGLDDIRPSESRYRRLKLINTDELSLKDYVEMKIYEAALPYQQESRDLKRDLDAAKCDLVARDSISGSLKKELEDSRKLNTDLTKQQHQLTLTLNDNKSQHNIDIYKTLNFDAVKRQSDEFELKYGDLKNEFTVLSNLHDSTCKDFNGVKSELNVIRQSISLLRQDKDFLSSKNHDLSRDLAHALTRAQTGDVSLERAKSAREDLYDKYVSSRDEQRADFEDKLRNEIDKIRTQTDVEIERLKSTCHQTFERENRGLREARDQAVVEKQQCKTSEAEVLKRYDDLLQEYRHLQSKQDIDFGDMAMQLKLKSFEAERTYIVHEETSKSLTSSHNLTDKLQKKLDVLTKEYYTLQMFSETKQKDLQVQLVDKTEQLISYEKIEQELDQVIMQAAEVEDEMDGDKVLASYGYGANIPTQSKRRLKQSVDLARRVLSLERANTSLRKDLQASLLAQQSYKERLDAANSLLDQTKQPHHLLVKYIKDVELSLKTEKQENKKLSQMLESVNHEREKLQQNSNKMAGDMKYLISQSQEISEFKDKMKMKLQRSKSCNCNCKKTSLVKHCKSAEVKFRSTDTKLSRCSTLDDTTPKPLIFTIPEKKKLANVPKRKPTTPSSYHH